MDPLNSNQPVIRDVIHYNNDQPDIRYVILSQSFKVDNEAQDNCMLDLDALFNVIKIANKTDLIDYRPVSKWMYMKIKSHVGPEFPLYKTFEYILRLGVISENRKTWTGILFKKGFSNPENASTFELNFLNGCFEQYTLNQVVEKETNNIDEKCSRLPNKNCSFGLMQQTRILVHGVIDMIGQTGAQLAHVHTNVPKHVQKLMIEAGNAVNEEYLQQNPKMLNPTLRANDEFEGRRMRRRMLGEKFKPEKFESSLFKPVMNSIFESGMFWMADEISPSGPMEYPFGQGCYGPSDSGIAKNDSTKPVDSSFENGVFWM